MLHPSAFRVAVVTDFKVVADELDQASDSFQQHSSSAETLAGALSSISLGAGDFGRMPGQGDLYAAYRANHQQCMETLREVSNSLKEISAGLTETSNTYNDMERQAVDVSQRYFSEI